MAGNTDIAAINLKCKYPEVLDSHYFSDAFFIWGVAPIQFNLAMRSQ